MELPVLLVILGLIVFMALLGIKMVPQQQAWVVQKLGKYDRTLPPGLSFIIPYIQRVAYKHSLKEQAIDIPHQTAITKDNVTIDIDGVLYVRVMDAVKTSYGVNDPNFAIVQLAQTTMRSEIGKIELDKTFEERETLNHAIVTSINEASAAWGLQCMRYEIKDILPPASVRAAMEKQVAADREKRAEILRSEGERQALINVAEANKQEVVLKSEAALTDQVNRAKGEAEAILSVAHATAEGIHKIAASTQETGGAEAISLKIAQQYVDAFRELAKESTTILLPSNASDVGSMVSQAMSVMQTIDKQNKKNSSSQKDGSPWETV